MNKEGQHNSSLQKYLALSFIFIGLILLAYMIIIEDEPGGVPGLMILVGTIWLIIKKYSSKTNP